MCQKMRYNYSKFTRLDPVKLTNPLLEGPEIKKVLNFHWEHLKINILTRNSNQIGSRGFSCSIGSFIFAQLKLVQMFHESAHLQLQLRRDCFFVANLVFGPN